MWSRSLACGLAPWGGRVAKLAVHPDAEALRREAEQAEGREQGHDPGLTELQAGGGLARRSPTGQDELGELALAEATVMRNPLRLEQAAVDALPERAEVGEVTRPLFTPTS